MSGCCFYLHGAKMPPDNLPQCPVAWRSRDTKPRLRRKLVQHFVELWRSRTVALIEYHRTEVLSNVYGEFLVVECLEHADGDEVLGEVDLGPLYDSHFISRDAEVFLDLFAPLIAQKVCVHYNQ